MIDLGSAIYRLIIVFLLTLLACALIVGIGGVIAAQAALPVHTHDAWVKWEQQRFKQLVDVDRKFSSVLQFIDKCAAEELAYIITTRANMWRIECIDDDDHVHMRMHVIKNWGPDHKGVRK